MKILCISDLLENSDHSSVNGIFGSNLYNTCSCDVVYFSKRNKQHRNNNKIIIPYRAKRKGLIKLLSSQIDFNSYDFVVVRNFFPVLKQIIKQKNQYKFKVGFWESFPHSYRRLHEAQHTHKSILRKTIEYHIKNKIEDTLLSKVDFYLPITDKFTQVFRPNLDRPTMALPMGVDFRSIPNAKPENHIHNAPIKFIYIGTVDSLRNIDLIIEAFSAIEGDYILDIFTASNNSITNSDILKSDRRISIRSAIPREQLLNNIMEYDVGIGLIPENKLYIVSSPTKTLEYYAASTPAIINNIPDYKGIFNQKNAFYCQFDKKSIIESIKKILLMPKQELKSMGESGKKMVSQRRDYKVLSDALKSFLQSI